MKCEQCFNTENCTIITALNSNILRHNSFENLFSLGLHLSGLELQVF